MKTILISYAVKEEFSPLHTEKLNIQYVLTGIGKARSAMKLTEAIIKYQPDVVINVGTAGTITHQVGNIFTCLRFVDRDYQQTKLPGIEYEIDHSELFKKDSSLDSWLRNHDRTGICSTGDTFVTEAASFQEDVVDMEAYAQALVCKEFNTPFFSVKYVTDIIGQNSVKHWEDKLSDAQRALTAWVEERI
ncbi:nucleosidase [Bacteroides sp. 224]|uniref:5'-methylthioadenosine/S-adenosylhomocysteine nucleosidase family protein n=1 Tax=Bacteroides sp. 224 TaxID=2302936 RepID=UPI0013D34216|nr:nucleosidase [Bacteroides sp. 224]NDV65905.1 nucleosidase [Bacteroides sp. 224]